MTRTPGSVTVQGFGRCILASAIGGLLAVPALSARAAATPGFHNNNPPLNLSQLSGDQGADITTGPPTTPADVISNMPASGTIPGSPTLLAPWPSTGNTITSG